MRIAILGAGPAGLYLAYLIKRRRADADVTLIERSNFCATTIRKPTRRSRRRWSPGST
jgi:flavin-dependent dehydrogenase